MRPYVEANQEMGRLHTASLDVSGTDAALIPENSDMSLIERAINGVELADYAEPPDSGTSARPPAASPAEP